MSKSIYDKVVELCEEKDISQRQLQRDLNLSVSTISRWKVSTPRQDTLQAVADYFNVSTDYLTGRTKYRNTEHMLQCFDASYKPDMSNTMIPDNCIQTDEGIVSIEVKTAAPKYIDPETRELAEKIMNNDKLKYIFDVLTNSSDERISAYYNLVKSFEVGSM